MNKRDEFLLSTCDEAARKENPMFYEMFSKDDRWSIILVILDAAALVAKQSPQEKADE